MAPRELIRFVNGRIIAALTNDEETNKHSTGATGLEGTASGDEETGTNGSTAERESVRFLRIPYACLGGTNGGVEREQLLNA